MAATQLAIGAAALTVASAPASAASYWWDTNGTTAGSGTTGGTWDTTTANWTTNSGGTVATVTYLNDGSATATFSAGTNVTGSSTITVSGAIQSSGLTVEEGTVVLTGGALSLTGGTINVASTLTANNVLSPTFATAITKSGAGTLFVGAANTLTNPFSVTGGLLQIVNSGSLASAGDITLSSGTALVIDNSGANVADRFNNSSQIVYNAGANFAFTGAAGYATNEQVGNIVVSGDLTKNNPSATSIVANTVSNFLTLNGGAGGTTLTANQLQVQPGALLTIRGANIGATSNQFKLNDTSNLVIRGAGGTGTANKSIVTGVVGATSTSAALGTDFLTYSPSTGFAVLAAGDYAAITSGDTTQQNISLSGAQTVTSNTTINSIKAAAGSSATINPGSTLTLSSGMVLFNGSSTISGGTVSVPTDTTLETIVNAPSTISSAITGSNGVYKIGASNLTLSGNSNYSGTTTIVNGMLTAASNNALGDASQGTVVAAGSTLRLDGSASAITTAEPITISARTTGTLRGTANVLAQGIDLLSTPAGWLGGLDVVGNVTATGTITLNSTTSNVSNVLTPTISTEPGATLTVTSPFAAPTGGGSAGLAFTGAGTTILQADNAAALGSNVVRHWGGTVIVQNGNALGGSGLFGVFMINYDHATIGIQAPVGNPGITVNAPIGQLAGYGNGSLGLIENLGGDNTYAGVITLSNTAGTGNVNWNTYIPMYMGVQAGSLTIASTFAAGGQRHFVKTGTGEMIFAAKEAVSGPLDVTAGTLTIGGVNGYNAPAFATVSNAVNVSSGATLYFDQSHVTNDGTATNFIDDYGDGPVAEPINLYGGELKLKGNIGAAQNLNFQGAAQGTFPLSTYGSSTLTVVDSGSGTTITAPTRANGETYLIRGATANAHVMLTTDGSGLVGGSGSTNSSTVSIYPSAIGDASTTGTGTDFVTYDSTISSYRPLNGSEYTALTNGNATLDNATATGSASITSATTVNSLKLTAANVSLSNTLNVNAGAILAVGGSSSISGGTVALGGNEGVFYATTGNTLSVSSPITGSNGLTLAGNGTINLTGNNTFTGKFQVDGGTVNVNGDAALGDANNTLALGGGTFAPANTYAASARSVTLLGQPTIGLSGGQTFSLTGVVAGAGQLGVSGNGTLVLTGANTWTGSTLVTNGATLSVPNVAALGPGQVNDATHLTRQIQLDNGTIQFTGNADLSNGFPIFFGKGNGTIDVSNGALVTLDIAAGATLPIYGPGALIKTGGGTLEFRGDSTNYNGGTFINGGILQIDISDTLPATAIGSTTTVNNGGTFQINNVNVTKQDLVINNGGTLSGIGNATYTGGGSVATADPQIASGATVTFKAPNATDTLTIAGAMVDLGTTPTINIDGAGTVIFGAAQNASFTANYLLKSGATMRLGSSTSATTFLGAASNTITVDTGGGTIQARIGAARTYGPYPVVLNGPLTINEQSTTTDGGGAFVETFGTLKVNGDQTVTLTHTGAGTGLNGIISGTLGGATFGNTTLAGNLTVNAANPADAPGAVGRITLGALSETGGSRSITKSGNGDLTLGGAGTISGDVNLNTGSLTVTSTPTVGRVVQAAGTTLTVNGASAKLTLKAGGTNASTLTAIPTFTGTAPEFDITNNKVIVEYTGTTLASGLRTALANGAKFVSNVPGWNGNGFVSANAKADANKVTGIGYLEASDLFGVGGGTYGNVTVDGTALLLKYTYFGDINFDGKVNADDYTLLDRGFAKYTAGSIAAGSAVWLNGDFNYDGAVNSNDYLLADTAFGKQSGTLSPAFLAEREAQFGSDYVSQLVAAVPEPTSLGIIGLAGLGMLARRRRQS